MPVLKPIDGHLGKSTRSSVFVSKSYFEPGHPKQVLNAAKYVPFDNLNVNITKLFCGLYSILLLLPTAAILE